MIENLIDDINMDVNELHFLTKAVKDADDIYTKEPTDYNYGILREVIDKYEKVVKRTKIRLEAYFQEEKELGLPPEFLYRRLYKKIQQATDD